MFRVLILFVFALISVISQASAIPPGYKKVANIHGVPVKIFYAILMQESSITTRLGHKPWPWTLNVKGESLRFKTRIKAHKALEKALKKTSLVDVGLGQVNWLYNGKHFKSTWQALDPYINLNIAAKILKSEYKRSNGDWWIAVGRYHSPGQKPHQKQNAKKYIQLVKKRYQKI